MDSETLRFQLTDVEGTLRYLRVRTPNQEEMAAAELELSGAFNEALLEGGLPPRQRMLRKLKAAGLWTSEDEQEMNTLRDELVRIDRAIRKEQYDTDDEKQELEDRKAAVFRQFNDFTNEIDAMLAHTCDAKAEAAQRNFLLACVIEELTEDGEVLGRVWEDVAALEVEDDAQLVQRVVYHWTCFNQGIEPNYERDFGLDDAEDGDQIRMNGDNIDLIEPVDTETSDETKDGEGDAAVAPVAEGPGEPDPATEPVDDQVAA